MAHTYQVGIVGVYATVDERVDGEVPAQEYDSENSFEILWCDTKSFCQLR